MTIQQAIDFVLGDGSFQKIAGEIYQRNGLKTSPFRGTLLS
jgi:hypothetical protein